MEINIRKFRKKLKIQHYEMLDRLFRENFRSHFRLYIIAILAMVVTAATTAASAYIMKDIVNSVVVEQNITKTFIVALVVALIFFLKGASTYVQSYFLARAGNSIIASQQRKVFNKILDSDIAFVQTQGSSEILVRVTHAAQAARSVIDTIVVSFVRDLFTLFGLVAVMFVQQPLLSLIAFVFGPIALLGLRILLANVRKIMESEMASIGEIIRLVQEVSTGFRVVKSYGLEGRMRDDMGGAIANVERRANAIARLEAATSPLMETLGGLAIAGAIALSGIAVVQQGQSPGALVSFITALLLAYEPAKRLARMRVSIESGMVGVRMLFELLDHPVVLFEKKDATPLPSGAGLIDLESIDFSYKSDQPVLKQLSASFLPGKVTALVGPSGSGKSTIINLIMRLFDPEGGRVCIDGMDIKDATLDSLRQRISYVGQDAFLFAGSIRHNIGLGKEGATDEEIVEAAKAANAHAFIMEMKDGYDTDVGENGNRLSGGQKQRLTIARAFLRDSNILILDEATSALDAASEVAIRDAVNALAEGRTSIVIAHRLSTVANADHIIVLDQGQIAEQGTPAELLRKNGLYRRLYEHQFLPQAV